MNLPAAVGGLNDPRPAQALTPGDRGQPSLQGILAKLTHVGLYALMIPDAGQWRGSRGSGGSRGAAQGPTMC